MGQMKINETQARHLDGLLPWVKLTRFGSIEVARLIGETPRGARLFMALFGVMDSDNAIVATLETLSDLCEMPARTVQRAVDDLTARSLIEVLQIQKRGAAHVYRVNDRVVWSGRGSRGRAVIKARVFLRGEHQTMPEQVGHPQHSLPFVDPKAVFALGNVYQPEGWNEPHPILDQPDMEELMRRRADED